MNEDDDALAWEDNIHFQAFRFCLCARRLGLTADEAERAFRGQWEATERMAGKVSPLSDRTGAALADAEGGE